MDTIWGSFKWTVGKAQMEREIRFQTKHGNLLIGGTQNLKVGGKIKL